MQVKASQDRIISSGTSGRRIHLLASEEVMADGRKATLGVSMGLGLDI